MASRGREPATRRVRARSAPQGSGEDAVHALARPFRFLFGKRKGGGGGPARGRARRERATGGAGGADGIPRAGTRCLTPIAHDTHNVGTPVDHRERTLIANLNPISPCAEVSAAGRGSVTEFAYFDLEMLVIEPKISLCFDARRGMVICGNAVAGDTHEHRGADRLPRRATRRFHIP